MYFYMYIYINIYYLKFVVKTLFASPPRRRSAPPKERSAERRTRPRSAHFDDSIFSESM